MFSTNLLAANGLSKPFADGESTGDSRFSGARGCSHLEVTKWRNILGQAVFFCCRRMKLRRTHDTPDRRV